MFFVQSLKTNNITGNWLDTFSFNWWFSKYIEIDWNRYRSTKKKVGLASQKPKTFYNPVCAISLVEKQIVNEQTSDSFKVAKLNFKITDFYSIIIVVYLVYVVDLLSVYHRFIWSTRFQNGLRLWKNKVKNNFLPGLFNSY